MLENVVAVVVVSLQAGVAIAIVVVFSVISVVVLSFYSLLVYSFVEVDSIFERMQKHIHYSMNEMTFKIS